VAPSAKSRRDADSEVVDVRTPPHSLEAEQAVLGGLLLDASAWFNVSDVVRAEDFYRPDHRTIFDAIRALASNQKPTDAVTVAELQAVLDLAADVKSSPGEYRTALAGKSIAMLFEKPSLRTRMTFELAIQELGGFALINDGRIGMREPLKDMARNLERWFNGIVARTFFQKTIDDLARWSNVPVVNALSDLYHPCQALADLMPSHVRNSPLTRLEPSRNVQSNRLRESIRSMDRHDAGDATRVTRGHGTAVALGTRSRYLPVL